MSTRKENQIQIKITDVESKLDSLYNEKKELQPQVDDLEVKYTDLLAEKEFVGSANDTALKQVTKDLQAKKTRLEDLERLIPIGEQKLESLKAELKEADKESKQADYERLKRKGKKEAIAFNEQLGELQVALEQLRVTAKGLDDLHFQLSGRTYGPLSIVTSYPNDLTKPADKFVLEEMPIRNGLQIPEATVNSL